MTSSLFVSANSNVSIRCISGSLMLTFLLIFWASFNPIVEKWVFIASAIWIGSSKVLSHLLLNVFYGPFVFLGLFLV